MRRLAAGALVVAVLGAAGCGGGSDSPTRREYAADLDKICRAQSDKLKNLDEPKGLGDIPDFADEIDGIVNQTADELEKVERPGGDARKTADQFVAAVREDVDKRYSPLLGQIKRAAQAKDQRRVVTAFQDLQRLDTPRANKLASQLGAKQCAASSS